MDTVGKIILAFIAIYVLWSFLPGCATNPYYSGTAVIHAMPCDRDNCGKPWYDAAGFHR